MSGRKQEFNRQFYQILDGTLLVLAFWASHALRSVTSTIPFFEPYTPDIDDSRWLLFLIMPFGPIFLEIQGYYSHPLTKTLSRSCKQMFRAGIWLTFLISASAFFFKMNVPGRGVFIIFAILGPIFLQIREQIGRASCRERV